MEAEYQKISSLVGEVSQHVDHMRSFLASKPVNAPIREAFTGVEMHLSNFAKAWGTDDLDSILRSASSVGIYGQALGMRTAGLEIPDVELIRQPLTEQSTQLRKLAEEGPLTFKPMEDSAVGLQNFQPPRNESQAQLARHAAETKKLLNDNGIRLSAFEQKLNGIENTLSAEIQKITQAYEAAKADIDEKTDHINRVTGQAAARMIAGDYEGSAAVEKETADNLRLGALACMLLIVAVLGWAVLESTIATFEWERFLSKVSLVFLLGVPATYLARESAKHREQQYHHLQTSLDMKAISPFLASLPDEAQHKLKADIASRIFGGRDFSKVSNDPYPLNTHEIIMKLIDKVDFSNKPGKAPVKPEKPEKAPKKPTEGASAAPAEPANQ
ncbi:hypothetical protein V7V80_04510 [Pseudomonas kermanshahensis]|uniref:Uncharacterized protein n=1 Tax=Pseudomonas kermanshahensis TaxID=2745482 RepID=A0ABU8R2E5_9PSED